jgi:crotonobetainyl-CoA:carnitine CoA-transferase CaiB-like acyl-CoA transferase
MGQGPLSHLKVIDLSRVRAGPNCVRVLADFGAQVIRVEPPPGVDPNESMFMGNRNSGDFQNLNRNKRSLTLNFKKPEAIEVFMRLVREADVVVENWRPDVKARLGLDYESLRQVNSRIILASISGYGQTGPYVKRPSFDQVMQGMGGLMSVTGDPGSGPMRAGTAVADLSAGLYAAIGIFVALTEREKSSQGQWVQSDLLHAQIAMMDFQVARYANEGTVPVQEGNNHPTCAPMGMFKASDGHLNLGVAGDGLWARFCRLIGTEAWLAEPDFADEALRVKHRPRLNALVNEVFSQQTVAYWVKLLNDGGVPAGPVYSIPDLLSDEQVQHLGVLHQLQVPHNENKQMSYLTQPVKLSRTPATVRAPAPEWGEHTDDILIELGYSNDEINELRSKGVTS